MNSIDSSTTSPPDSQHLSTPKRASTLRDRLTRSVFGLSALGAILLWACQPPLGWSFLAWIALVPWTLLVLHQQLTGRRPYLQFWMAAWMYWLITLYFIPIPHPGLWVGWPLMSAVLATYFLVFLIAARRAVWTFRVPAYIAVPIVWVGVEWIRTQGALSFGMMLLSHSQYRIPLVIQCADLLGAFGLSFLIAIVSASIALVWNRRVEKKEKSEPTKADQLKRQPLFASTGFAIGSALVALAIVIGYGAFRLKEIPETAPSSTPNTLIIQGSVDTQFPQTEEQADAYIRKRIEDYRRLTIEARRKYPTIGFVIWPESAYVQPIECNSTIEFDANYFDYATGNDQLGASGVITLLTGAGLWTDRLNDRKDKRRFFNSAVLLPNTETSWAYLKVHCVPFGEYIPLLSWFPFFESLSPIGPGLSAGEHPVIIPIDTAAGTSLEMLPSICFESTVPHLIRSQMDYWDDSKFGIGGARIDYLVNLTDDGWFFGTSCLDFHLACNVFRAIENRRPMIVAANTGFSAEIDCCGRIVQQGARRGESILAVELVKGSRRYTFYRYHGDIGWMLAGVFTGLCLLTAMFFRLTKKSP